MTEESIISLAQPHKNQRIILENKRRFNIVKTGRRFGKTEIVKLLASYAIEGKFVGIWLPVYKDLADVWREMIWTFYPLIVSKNEQVKQIILVNGGLIDFWSMDDPDSGRGRKYHRVIMDEFAKAKKSKQAWQETIRPTLTDYKGDAWFFSTPKGKTNYFYQLEQNVKDDPLWAVFKYTSYDNPLLDPSEIDSAKNQLDDLTFRQEYLAEDVDANDRPFLYSFDESKHVVENYQPNPHIPITLSFDFNVNPMTVLVGQRPNVKTIYVFDEISLEDSSTEEICEFVKAKYIGWLNQLEVTGDSTGLNRSAMARGNINHYRIIKQQLSLRDMDLKVERVNMGIRDSRVLCNSVLQNAHVLITKNCHLTIRDLKMAAVDEYGDLIKNTQFPQHKLDAWRYIIGYYFRDFIKNPYKYR